MRRPSPQRWWYRRYVSGHGAGRRATGRRGLKRQPGDRAGPAGPQDVAAPAGRPAQAGGDLADAGRRPRPLHGGPRQRGGQPRRRRPAAPAPARRHPDRCPEHGRLRLELGRPLEPAADRYIPAGGHRGARRRRQHPPRGPPPAFQRRRTGVCAVTYFSGEVYAGAAMAVGFVVGWAVRRPTITASALPLFGAVAAGLAVAGVLLGWIVFDIAQIAKVNHLDLLTAAKTVDSEYGWGQVLRDPFASPLDWLFFALAIFVAFGAAARARPGLARRAR